MTGSTLTRADSLLIVFISAAGRVGRHRMGFVVTGGSRMTGSASGWEKLFVRALDTRGAGGAGAEGGTIKSGSKKYMQLEGCE